MIFGRFHSSRRSQCRGLPFQVPPGYHSVFVHQMQKPVSKFLLLIITYRHIHDSSCSRNAFPYHKTPLQCSTVERNQSIKGNPLLSAPPRSLQSSHDHPIATNCSRRRRAHADEAALVAQEEGTLAVAEEGAIGRARACVLSDDLPVCARRAGRDVAEEDVGGSAVAGGDALGEGCWGVAGEGAGCAGEWEWGCGWDERSRAGGCSCREGRQRGVSEWCRGRGWGRVRDCLCCEGR